MVRHPYYWYCNLVQGFLTWGSVLRWMNPLCRSSSAPPNSPALCAASHSPSATDAEHKLGSVMGAPPQAQGGRGDSGKGGLCPSGRQRERERERGGDGERRRGGRESVECSCWDVASLGIGMRRGEGRREESEEREEEVIRGANYG